MEEGKLVEEKVAVFGVEESFGGKPLDRPRLYLLDTAKT